jgi:hypothetical protein
MTGDNDPDREDATVTPATIDLTAAVPSPSISIRQHGWIVWAQIAIDHEKDARRARETGETTEHLPGLVAIAAAAFALDALYGAAKDLIPIPEADGVHEPDDCDELDNNRKRKRARRVAECLRRGVSPGKLGESWPKRIRELYSTRDAAVHFGEKDSDPVWHPGWQSNTSPEAVAWRLEEAESAVDLMLEVFEGWARHPSAPIREWAERFRPSVDDLLNRRSS